MQALATQHIKKQQIQIYKKQDKSPTDFLILKQIAKPNASKNMTNANATVSIVTPKGFQYSTLCLKAVNPDDTEIEQRGLDLIDKLTHRNIIRVISSFTDDEKLFVLMDLADESLKNKLDRENLDYFVIARIFNQTAEAIEYLHQQKPPMIHRDLKPENILLFYDEYAENQVIAKLCDFGTVIQTSNPVTEVAGTTGFYSPEQILNKQYFTPTDVWSLGCILYQMCTRKKLFATNDDTMKGINDSVVSELTDQGNVRQLFQDMMQQDPLKRISISQVYIVLKPDIIQQLMNKIRSLEVELSEAKQSNKNSNYQSLIDEIERLKLENEKLRKLLQQKEIDSKSQVSGPLNNVSSNTLKQVDNAINIVKDKEQVNKPDNDLQNKIRELEKQLQDQRNENQLLKSKHSENNIQYIQKPGDNSAMLLLQKMKQITTLIQQKYQKIIEIQQTQQKMQMQLIVISKFAYSYVQEHRQLKQKADKKLDCLSKAKSLFSDCSYKKYKISGLIKSQEEKIKELKNCTVLKQKKSDMWKKICNNRMDIDVKREQIRQNEENRKLAPIRAERDKQNKDLIQKHQDDDKKSKELEEEKKKHQLDEIAAIKGKQEKMEDIVISLESLNGGWQRQHPNVQIVTSRSVEAKRKDEFLNYMQARGYEAKSKVVQFNFDYCAMGIIGNKPVESKTVQKISFSRCLFKPDAIIENCPQLLQIVIQDCEGRIVLKGLNLDCIIYKTEQDKKTWKMENTNVKQIKKIE